MTNSTAIRIGSRVAIPIREPSQTVLIDQINVLTVVVLSLIICSDTLKDLSDIPLVAGGRGQDSWPLAGVPKTAGRWPVYPRQLAAGRCTHRFAPLSAGLFWRLQY